MEDDRIERPDKTAESAAHCKGDHLCTKRIDASCLGGKFVLFDREHRKTKAGALNHMGQDQNRDHHNYAEQGIDARVFELHPEDWRIPMHRKRELLPAHPIEKENEQRRIGEHGQREIVPAQAKRDGPDYDAGQSADRRSGQHANPGRHAKVDHQDCHREGAQSDKGRVSEGYQACISAEQIPGKSNGRPDRDHAHDELEVGIADGERHDGHKHPNDQDERKRGPLPWICEHYIRSTVRPKIPWGRQRTTARKSRNIVAFCN